MSLTERRPETETFSLRGLALALLAFAFARPLFYRQSDMNISEAEGRRIAILVDTSASMRRDDLWTQAGRRVDKVLAMKLPPTRRLFTKPELS